jgi:fructokinase
MRLGVDLGGTKIEVIALDSAGLVLVRERVATPRGYNAILDAICGLVNSADCAGAWASRFPAH